MRYGLNHFAKAPLLAVTVLFGGLLLAGCDEHVEIVRNKDIPVLKHQTWAWRPAPAAAAARRPASDERPVISRDVIGGPRQPSGAPVAAPDPVSESVRQDLRTALERHLTEKGLTQVTDPAAADFLVDYHFAMRRENVAVPVGYPGAYPGLVCGPFGCYQGWGYGPPVVGYENVHFREGTFVFTFFRRQPNGLAYRAIGVEPPHHGTFSHGEVDSMVHALLKGLKPKG